MTESETPTTTPETATDAPEAPAQPAPELPQPKQDVSELPEWARDALTKANSEAAGYRTKLRQVEPLAKKAQELEEAQKTEQEKLTERAAEAERARDSALSEAVRFRVAAKHGITEEDFDLLGSGTEEQIEARAVRIAAKNVARQAPPSERPVEQLRPGASPTQSTDPSDDAYPAHWLPANAGPPRVN